jgi:hypothetical protein
MKSPLPPPDPEEIGSGEEDEDSQAIPEFKETDDFDLELDVHMEAHQEAGTLVAKGKNFGPHRADAIALAEVIKSFVTTLFEIAVKKKRPTEWVVMADLDSFEFASAHIRFIVGDGETIRMEDSTSPTVDAASYVSDLMAADGDELLTLAQEVGPKGAKAYRQLLKVVSEAEDATIGWRSFGRKPVVVTSANATKNFITLDREGESESDEITVPGHLSMADAGRRRFTLELPKGWPRPPELKRKRNIEGSYEESVNQLVKSQGLWNSDVIASIRINREREETVAAPRKPKYELLSVEPTTESSVLRKNAPGIPGSVPLDEDVFGDAE